MRITPLNILVTGGAGFLGAHLCKNLLSNDHNVFCLDNFSTGTASNIAPLHAHPRFSFVSHDVCEPFDMNADIELDQIYNLACPASPEHYQSDPIKTMKTSVFGALHMLELAEHHKARILQSSTSEIYGDPKVHPQKETYWGHVNANGIRACYDEGKRSAETLFFDYHRQLGVDIRIARIFNTYGPGMQINDGRVVSNFIVASLLNKDISIYGDGTQTRSFCYVDDLIKGLTTLMQAENAAAIPINMGNANEFTILELAEIIVDLTNSKSKILHAPLPQDDPIQRCPDLTRATKILGWKPRVDLTEGLRNTIAFFEQELQTGRAKLSG